jgi:putative peptidoglycan lipid II flippase
MHMPDPYNMGKPDSSASSSLVLMVSTLLSRLLGIVRVSIISAVFGAGGTADVINFTFSIPNNIRKLLAEGALSSAFIPVLTRAFRGEGKTEDLGAARRLTEKIFGFQVTVLLPLTAAALLFPEPVIKALSDFSDPGQLSLAASLLRFFVLYLVIISATAVIQAVLHCRFIFTVSALAPLVFSVTVILSIILLSDSIGAYSMAAGVLAGGLLQMAVQLPSYLRQGFRLRISFSFIDDDFKAVMRLFIPVLLTSGILAAAQQVSFYLASRLPTGAVTAFANAIVFWQMPFGVFYVSIATVFFPMMSRASQQGNRAALEEQLRKGVGYITVFLIPSALMLFFFSRELSYSLLVNGRFTPDDAERTAAALRAFAPGLLFGGLFNYTQRYFFAVSALKPAVKVALVFGVTDILLTAGGIALGLDVYAFGAAASIAYAFSFAIQLRYIRKQLPEFKSGRLFREGAKVVAANLPLLVLLTGYAFAGGTWYLSGRSAVNILLLTGAGSAGAAATAAVYRASSIDFLFRKGPEIRNSLY